MKQIFDHQMQLSHHQQLPVGDPAHNKPIKKFETIFFWIEFEILPSLS